MTATDQPQRQTSSIDNVVGMLAGVPTTLTVEQMDEVAADGCARP